MENKDITEKGAVLLEEGQLDMAGAINFTKIEIEGVAAPRPVDQLNFTKIEF